MKHLMQVKETVVAMKFGGKVASVDGLANRSKRFTEAECLRCGVIVDSLSAGRRANTENQCQNTGIALNSVSSPLQPLQDVQAVLTLPIQRSG